MKNVKIAMRTKARNISGLVNLLKDDAVNLSADTNDFDLISLEESIRDAKSTLQMLTDNVTELEYSLYLCKRGASR